MQFSFTTDDKSEEMTDAIRCLENILSIPEGSIPLNRGIGLSWASLSSVPEDIENDYATELMEKVEEYEPRVRVTDVQFTHSESGSASASIQAEMAESDGSEEENE